MAKGTCPVCESLEEIASTGEALEYRTEPDFSRVPVGSACFWQLCLHPDKRGEPVDGAWPICLGSGRRI